VKVCILAAGLGTRMGPAAAALHKALMPLGNRAVISRIMDQFPADAEFVIATGSRAEQVESFLRLAHPGARLRFVRVEPFAGPGAGPGRSLLCCRGLLDEPFFFTACDTLVAGPLPAPDADWIGVAATDAPERWCAAHTDAALRVSRLDYKLPGSTARHAFAGIAHVRSHAAFWRGLERAAADSGEVQVNAGLEALIPLGLQARVIDWRDAGNWEAYQALLPEYDRNFTFTGKSTEVTYRYGERVLKLFADADRAARWAGRAAGMGRAAPEVLGRDGPVLAYRFVSGEPLSRSLDGASCRRFLDWLEAEFWRGADLDPADYARALRAFYVDKSLARLADFDRRHAGSRAAGPGRLSVNGVSCRPAGELVRAAAAVACAADGRLGRPSTLHGDLHADNVLVDGDRYRLIDWRDDFAGLPAGDRTYDLAKFLHTLDFSVAAMESGRFAARWTGADAVAISHAQEFRETQARDAFRAFLAARGYETRRVDVVNGLIFLNMSPLYERELGEYLCLLGRLVLEQALAGADANATGGAA
jgi:hypothetical protein